MTEVKDTQEAQVYRQPSSNEPFKSRRAAYEYMAGVGLSDNDWAAVQCGDGVPGWEIKRIVHPEKPQIEPEKFFRVVFHAKSSVNDTDDVILAVNGEILQIRREREVIIPGRFKECADHATFQQFRQEPGKPRKIVGTIKVYPYNLIGEATEGEYITMRREGTKKQAAMVAKHGFDVDPDAIEQ